jgi:phage-related minor tail protein
MANNKVGLLGESGAEGVLPLACTADGKLGVSAAMGRASNDNGGGFSFHAGTTQLIVNGNVGNETMLKIQAMLDQHANRIEASVLKSLTRNLRSMQTAHASRYAG